MAERHSNRLYFESSREIFVQVTDIFDFVWPTAAAMWNLRWQVAGYVSANPSATIEEIDGRFVAGSGIHGANLRRSCIDHSWSQQQDQFAKLLLINIIALYESWLKSILRTLAISDQSIERQMQSPTIPRNGKPYGVTPAIQAITANESTMLKNNFYSSLTLHRKNRLPKIENLFITYRFFKECRNCLMHAGGLANQRACDAYAEFSKIATASNLGAKEVPRHEPIALGQPVAILLRGIVGFCDIVLCIVATLDAELSRSNAAERELSRRWVTRYGRKRTLPSRDEERRDLTIVNLITNLGLPRPSAPKEITTFLGEHRLVW